MPKCSTLFQARFLEYPTGGWYPGGAGSAGGHAGTTTDRQTHGTIQDGSSATEGPRCGQNERQYTISGRGMYRHKNQPQFCALHTSCMCNEYIHLSKVLEY